MWLRGRLRERYDAREALLVDSGTTALRLALAACGSPAALPAYSCYDLATAAVGAGVRVVLYDIEPSTLAPEPASLERALATGARSVVVAPLYGVPLAMGPIRALCSARGAVLIEDAAQGHGAAWGGVPVGANGSLAVLSFARGKGWTGGGGGALLAHDEPAEALREVRGWAGDAGGLGDEGSVSGPGGGDGAGGGRGWRVLSRAAAQWALGRPSLYGLPRKIPHLRLGETLYRPPWAPGGLSAAAAAALRASEAAAEEEVGRRRAHAERLLGAIREGGRLRPVTPPPGSEPGWLRMPALLPEEERQRIPTGLGVYRGYPTPLRDLEALRPRLVEGATPNEASRAFPGAKILAVRLVTLPTHGALRERDLRALERWVLGVGGPP